MDTNPETLGDTPVSLGTRVPVQILMEHIEAGDRLGGFLDDNPTMSSEQAVKVIGGATTTLAGEANGSVA